MEGDLDDGAGVAPNIRHHWLTGDQFGSLAVGEGDAGTVDQLLAGERSRRLLLLRLLLDLLSRRAGILDPLPPAETTWKALVDADKKDSSAVQTVLMSPQFGIWLSRAIRLLKGGASSPFPLWVELGHLHAGVVAAAIRAKIDLSLCVPVCRGFAMLPTLGMARIDTARPTAIAEVVVVNGACQLRCDGDEITLPPNPALDGPGWWGLQRIRVQSGRHALSVWLDDIDPYRDLADPVPPARLAATEQLDWHQMIAQAWTVLCRTWPEEAHMIALGLSSIAPLPSDEGFQIRSASSGDGFGAALISTPTDPVPLAVSLIHEFQHMKLGSLLHLTPLLDEDAYSVLTYAPWRNDPRPLPGLLQGIYAFFGIARFWRRYRALTLGREQRAADFEYAYARRQVRDGLATLMRSGHTTELGAVFVDKLGTRVRSLMADAVSSDANRASWAASADHRTTWRLRHLRPDPEWIDSLAGAFRMRRTARPTGLARYRLEPGRSERWLRNRLVLYRMRLLAPDRFRLLTLDSEAVPPAIRGASRADFALVSGDLAVAEAGYRDMIASDPNDVSAWAGLVVSVAANRSTPAWRTLVRRPEIVRAVYLACRFSATALSPTVVTEWLEGV